MRYEDVAEKILLAGLNRTPHEWLCNSFAELIEGMELWKCHGATGDFGSSELMWAGEAAMRKSIAALRQAGFESISDLPRIQKSYKEKAFVLIPPVMEKCATSNSEQKVQVLIPVVQGLLQKQQHLMQQCFELVDWQGPKLPSAVRRRRDSLNCF